MSVRINTPRIIATICFSLAAAFPATAREMVSIKGNIVNMRSGPGTHTAVQWELKKGYPLEVIRKRGSWLYVRDFENDRGWVARSLTARIPHHVVKAAVANIRKGPGTSHRIVGQAIRYDLLRTRETRNGWVRVEHKAGGHKGWVAKKLLWGW